MKPTKNATIAAPIIDYADRDALLSYLKKTYGNSTALIAKICMSTGLPAPRILQLKYKDIPQNGLLLITKLYLNSRNYHAMLPSDVIHTINTMRALHEPDEYIFLSKKKNRSGHYEPMHANTFAGHVAKALTELPFDNTNKRYSAKSLQKTYFYDTYICYGIEYVRKLVGLQNNPRTYEFIGIECTDASDAMLSNFPELNCKSELELCKANVAKVELLANNTTNNTDFFKDCTLQLKHINTLLDNILNLQTKHNL